MDRMKNNEMQNLNRAQIAGISAVLAIIAIIIGWSALHSAPTSNGFSVHDAPAASTPASITPGGASRAADPAPAPPSEVVVHVAGAVKQPGVYHLPPGARCIDGLNAAGGPTPDANPDAVNLAAKLVDGMQLYIPTRTEQQAGGAPGATPAPDGPTNPVTSEAGASATSSRSSSHGSNKLSDITQGQIDLNTATAEDLQRIPGVGPSMAARIIAFREQNQGFKSVQDLRSVPGIGDKKFARMSPFATVR